MRQTERIEAEEGASVLHPDSLAEEKRESIEEVNVETVGMDVITGLGKVEIERENVLTVRGEDGIDIPTVQECVSDREKIKKQIFNDDSLKNLRQLANENERGYSWVDGFFVHEIEGDAGEIHRRLVVPRVR